MATLVIDTNILVMASPKSKDFDPKASEFIWAVYNICHSVAIDVESKIMDVEYKKHMKDDPTLIRWMKYMDNRKKIVQLPSHPSQVGDLDEMDNLFANVAVVTSDKVLVTTNFRHFNTSIQRKLAQRGLESSACRTLTRNIAATGD